MLCLSIVLFRQCFNHKKKKKISVHELKNVTKLQNALFYCFIKMKFESMLLFCIGLFMQLISSGPKIIKSLIVL